MRTHIATLQQMCWCLPSFHVKSAVQFFESLSWVFQIWHCLQPLNGPVGKQQLMTKVTGEEIRLDTSEAMWYVMTALVQIVPCMEESRSSSVQHVARCNQRTEV